MSDHTRAIAAINELADIFGPHALTDEFVDFLRDTLHAAVAGELVRDTYKLTLN